MRCNNAFLSVLLTERCLNLLLLVLPTTALLVSTYANLSYSLFPLMLEHRLKQRSQCKVETCQLMMNHWLNRKRVPPVREGLIQQTVSISNLNWPMIVWLLVVTELGAFCLKHIIQKQADHFAVSGSGARVLFLWLRSSEPFVTAEMQPVE